MTFAYWIAWDLLHVNFIFWANIKEAFETGFACVFVVFVIINFNNFLGMVKVEMLILVSNKLDI